MDIFRIQMVGLLFHALVLILLCFIFQEYNFDVDKLYEHLFSQESPMMKTVFEKRNFQGNMRARSNTR